MVPPIKPGYGNEININTPKQADNVVADLTEKEDKLLFDALKVRKYQLKNPKNPKKPQKRKRIFTNTYLINYIGLPRIKKIWKNLSNSLLTKKWILWKI